MNRKSVTLFKLVNTTEFSVSKVMSKQGSRKGELEVMSPGAGYVPGL